MKWKWLFAIALIFLSLNSEAGTYGYHGGYHGGGYRGGGGGYHGSYGGGYNHPVIIYHSPYYRSTRYGAPVREGWLIRATSHLYGGGYRYGRY